MSTSPGVCREREWLCLCPQPIRAWSCNRCPTCGASKPDTAAIKRVEVEARDVLDAIAEFDRLSGTFGRFQAMRTVLARYGLRREP